jgi:hypothetical protein
MTDTPNKTAEALLEKALRRAFALGQDYWADADSESYSANRRADDHRQKFETLVSETLASLAAQPQAEPVAADGFVLVPLEPTMAMEAAGSDAGDGHDWAGPRAVYRAMLFARPPVAPPTPAARREPGWNGPMVNDAAAQAEPVAATREVIAALAHARRFAHQPCENPADGFQLKRASSALLADLNAAWRSLGLKPSIREEDAVATLSARPPVAQQGAEEAVAEVRDGAIYSAKYNIKLAEFTRGASLPAGPLYAAPVAVAAQPVARGLTDEQIEDCIDEATRLFKMRNRSPGGQQITSYDSWNHWFARAIERALSTTHPARGTAMCDCTEYVNSQLVKFGGRLAVGVRIDPKTMDVTGRLLLVTEKTDKSKREPPIVSASFCPFCGEKVIDDVTTKASADEGGV